MKKLWIVFVMICCSLKAQQNPLYNFYHQQLSLLHPAFAGQLSGLDAGIFYRNTWATFDRSPEMVSVVSNFNWRTVSPFLPFGLGIHYQYDKMGGVMLNNFFIPFSYDFSFIPKKAGRLFLGIQFQIQHSFLYQNWIYQDGGDQKIPQNISRGFLPFNFDVGIGYVWKEKYYAGFTVARALGFNKTTGEGEKKIFDPRDREYLLYFGTVHALQGSDRYTSAHVLKTNLLATVNDKQFDVLLSADYLIKQIFFVGLSYDYLSTTGIRLGIEKMFNLQKTNFQWRLGYSGSYAWNYLQSKSFSHEIFSIFNLNLTTKKVKIDFDADELRDSRNYQSTDF